ncbi:hypothetical protein [Pseudomonas huanghezhanensis]|uniref:hypothetical protein n=1 Tax=Pseudomonas huanghezhanensis TaxID=3002903 RepID=UPI002285E161|nr:hypothetical protein [Pseudomonas sp. BSw22131]
MSSIHEQAMNYVYQQVLQRLTGYFDRAERTTLQLLIQRLIVKAGGIEQIGSFTVLVPFSGGKDSAYTLAFLRAAQLSIASRSMNSFNLRVANMRHAGMTSAVMDNIDRCYCALFLHDDPRVELLVVDHQYVQAFERELPLSIAGLEQNRSDMLLSGHLTADDGQNTFFNSCYLGMAEFLGLAATWGEGVDAVISGDSLKEQKHYATWIMQLAQRTGQPGVDWENPTFSATLKSLDRISRAYYSELYAEEFQPSNIITRAAARGDKPRVPYFLSVSDLIGARVEQHWALLTEFLGFRFDDLAFSLNESDCANPLLMAHMQGLKSEFILGLDYALGITQYLELAKALMRRKHMPKRLLEQALAAYDDPEKLAARRSLANGYAQEAFGLSETQLICLLFAPFVEEGAALEAFLRRCHPGMLVALSDLHRALSGRAAPDQVIQWLVDVSGLTLKDLRNLYGKQRANPIDEHSVIARVPATDLAQAHGEVNPHE